MSKNSSALNDINWNNFISTGSVYDYLKYKSENSIENNSARSIVFENSVGGFCENRNKWNSDKRS